VEEKIKTKIFKKRTESIYMYIFLDSDKDCDPLHDTPPLKRENATHHTKLQLPWLQPKSGHESQRGWTPWQTGHQLQSNSDCPTMDYFTRLVQYDIWIQSETSS